MIKRILVAVDFSPSARKVLTAAIEQAKAHKAQMLLVHVEAPEPDFVSYKAGPASVRKSVSSEIRKDHKSLHRMEEKCRSHGIKTKALLIQGYTSDKILKEARLFKADLIVMGTHIGWSSIKEALLGSVSKAVLHKATCPVLLLQSR